MRSRHVIKLFQNLSYTLFLELFLTHHVTANRWSLFSHMVSVRPSVTNTKRAINNAKVKARKTQYALQRTPCVKIMRIYWLGPGGSA